VYGKVMDKNLKVAENLGIAEEKSSPGVRL